MALFTTLARMWLTRSWRPFQFRNEYDQVLPYDECKKMGLYVHIPFCRTLCDFCPYCKVPYEPERANRYVENLLQEIRLVCTNHPKREVTSLYFGGGTPALLYQRLEEIIQELRRYFVITEGIGVELHPSDVTIPVLQELRRAGVTKLSIGIQSFQKKYQTLLGRSSVEYSAISAALTKVPFETVSFDFIFALPGQTISDLICDVDLAFQLGANHVALYPFIDFSFAKSDVQAMNNPDKRKLLNEITAYLEKNGCTRTSIWTFSNEKGACYSSMTRENFLGFGCSATTLLNGQFKINTFSPEAYGDRISHGRLPTSLTLRFSKRQRMVYYLFWTAYSTWVDPKEFQLFFGEELSSWYGVEFWLAQRLGWLEKKDGKYHLTLNGAFAYHYLEGFYTLKYIDKMWNTMRESSFPSKLRL